MSRLKKHKEEPEDAGRWLLTYSDMITLLLGLFVILYGMSKIDTEKYEQVVVAMGGIFGRDGGIMEGKRPSAGDGLSPLQRERNNIQKEIQHAIGGMASKGLVSLSQNERGVTVHLTEELLFNSGSADLKQTSLNVLDSLAAVLKTLPNDVRIEGHTDNIPIHTDKFPSNWHLSVIRAVNTSAYMMNKHGLRPEQLSVAGYAEFRPLAPNTTESNRSQNRRVDIVIVTNVVHESITR
jgi:chemotaxis protein MotB